jgi:2-dehydro-3-deoxygluconokinase
MDNRIVAFREIMFRLVPPGFERFSETRQFMASFGGGDTFGRISV